MVEERGWAGSYPSGRGRYTGKTRPRSTVAPRAPEPSRAYARRPLVPGRPMDFLLECIGFPPGHDLDQVAREVLARGERVAWRGPRGTHLRLPFAGGIEVRLDRDEGEEHCTLWPHLESRGRLRVAVTRLEPLPDSPYDRILTGRANPPPPERGTLPEAQEEGYTIATYLSDARRLPADLPRGHVLAVSVAGFGIDVTAVGPDEGREPVLREERPGARLLPVQEPGHPRGCMELSLRVRTVRRVENPLTGAAVQILETDAPGRPLDVLVSPWQLAAEGLEAPRPGWRIEGAFLFTGRVAGGLPPVPERLGVRFG